MEALVSPCSEKGVSGRCGRTGDPPCYSRARRGAAAAAAPPRPAVGLRSSHVATIRRGLGGFPPIFIRRRAVILPTFPPSLRYSSSCFSSLTADTAELQADTKACLCSETETTKVQMQTAIESVQADAETKTAKDQTRTMSESRTVHVKFKLQKSCQFGERFFIVGEDPIFGLWEPASAVPLEWSNGHVWMAELDLPVEKEIKFKFILQRLSGEIKWQPGPDRILRTWKTTNSIVVEYGWENSEDQKITEEGSSAIPAEREASRQSEKETDGEIVDNQIVKTNAKHENDLKFAEKKHIGLERDPVLEPGLASMPTSTSVSASQNEVDGKVDGASLASEETDSKLPEDVPDKLDGNHHENESEHEAASSSGQLEGAVSHLASGQDSEGSEPQPTASVLENDVDWGRQTFQKFLMILGLFQ